MPTTPAVAAVTSRLIMAIITLAVTAFTVLTSTALHAQASSAPQGRLYAEIVKIDVDKKTVTLKAVMGHKTLRVARADMLDGFKEGDQVLFEVGQDGTEVIITILSPARK
jgi:Cu/Ag efflux protein CusF